MLYNCAWESNDNTVPGSLSIAGALVRLVVKLKSKVKYYEELARKAHLESYEDWERHQQNHRGDRALG